MINISERLADLRMARELYTLFLNDPTCTLFNDDTVKELLKKTTREIYRLEELIYNGEDCLA